MTTNNTTTRPAVVAPERTPEFLLRTANLIVGGVLAWVIGTAIVLVSATSAAGASRYADTTGSTLGLLLGALVMLVGLAFTLAGWHQRLQSR